MEAIEPCPDAAELDALILETLPAERMEQLTRHIGRCTRCQAALERAGDSKVFKLDLAASDPSPPIDAHPPIEFIQKMRSPDLETVIASSSDPEDLDFLTPTNREGLLGTLNSLEILEVIGRGGMGLVLRAHDPELQRQLAVKVLAPSLATNQSARERFIREARAVAAVDHRHVLPIYSVDRSGSLPYFTMPLVEGPSLQDLLDQSAKPMANELIISIAGKVASGLAAAHEQGLIHRDIKPANILLDEKADRVWLADFGLARAMEAPTLTVSGTLVGTPQFMAPEQLEDDPPSEKSDLFSLGSVLYYMAAGKPAFAADSTASTIRKVVAANTTPADQVNPQLPPWLSELIGQLLSKDPAKRPPSAQAVTATIERHAHPERDRRVLTWRWVSGAVGVLLIALIVKLALRPPPPTPFKLNSNGQRFATLAEAVNAAGETDTITVTTPHAQVPDVVSWEGKHLTLAAPDQGSLPTLDFSPPISPRSQDHPRLAVAGNLTLNGLRIVRTHTRPDLPEGFGHAPIIEFRGDMLRIENCRFELGQDPYVEESPPVESILVHEATNCDLRSSVVLQATRGIFILFRNAEPTQSDSLRLALHDNVLFGVDSCLSFQHSHPRPVFLEVTENILYTKKLIGTLINHSWASFRATDVSSNVFCLEDHARPAFIRVQDVLNFKEHFHWRGRDNLYAAAMPFDRVNRLPMLRKAGNPRPATGLSLWNGWTDQIREENFRLLALDFPPAIPRHDRLSEVQVENIFPEALLGE